MENYVTAGKMFLDFKIILPVHFAPWQMQPKRQIQEVQVLIK